MPPKMDPNKLKLRECKILCQSLSSAIKENPLAVASKGPLTSASGFATRSTVGLMLSGAVIDNMVIGGPAYNSQQLHKGDEIVSVDGKEVARNDLYPALIGNDVPGSAVVLKVRKVRTGNLEDVVLNRMATEMIADKRKMFELLSSMKEQADSFTAGQIETCLNLWTRITWAESENSKQVAQNFKSMQTQCGQWIEFLQKGLSAIEGSMEESASSNDQRQSTLVREQMENERLKEALKDVEKNLTQSRRQVEKQAEDMLELRKDLQALKAQEESLKAQLRHSKQMLDQNNKDGVEVRRKLSEAAHDHDMKAELLLARAAAAEARAAEARLRHERHAERLKSNAVKGQRPRARTAAFEEWVELVRAGRGRARVAEAVSGKVAVRVARRFFERWLWQQERGPRLEELALKTQRRLVVRMLNRWWQTSGWAPADTPQKPAVPEGHSSTEKSEVKAAAVRLRGYLRLWRGEREEAAMHRYKASKIVGRWHRSVLRRACSIWYQSTKEENYLRIPQGKVETAHSVRAMQFAWIHWTGVEAETKRDRRNHLSAQRSRHRALSRGAGRAWEAWAGMVRQHRCLVSLHNAVEQWSNARLLRCFVSEWLRLVLIASRDDTALQHRTALALQEGEHRRDLEELQGRLQGEQAAKGQIAADLERFREEARRREEDLQTRMEREKTQHETEHAGLTEQHEAVKETLEHTRKEFKEHMRLTKTLQEQNADNDRRIASLQKDLEKATSEMESRKQEHTSLASRRTREMQELNAQLTSAKADLVKTVEELNKTNQLIEYRDSAIKKLQAELGNSRDELRQEKETHEASVLQFKLQADKLHMQLTETAELAGDENKTLSKLRETQSILSQITSVQAETEAKLNSESAAAEKARQLLKESEAKLSTVEKQLKAAKDEVERSKSLLQQEQAEKRKFSGDLDFQGQELSQYKLQLQQARKDLSEAEAALQERAEALAGEKKARMEASTEAERAAEVLEGTQARLQSMEQEAASYRARLTAAEKDIEAEVSKGMEFRHSAQSFEREMEAMKGKLAEATREMIKLKMVTEQRNMELERAKESKAGQEGELEALKQEKNSLRTQLQQTGAELSAAMEAWAMKQQALEGELLRQKKETEGQENAKVKSEEHHRYLENQLKEQLEQAAQQLEAKSHELYTTTVQLRTSENELNSKVDELRKWQSTCEDLRVVVEEEREARRQEREKLLAASDKTRKVGAEDAAADETDQAVSQLLQAAAAKAKQAEAEAEAERLERELERVGGKVAGLEGQITNLEKELKEAKTLLDVTRLDLRVQTEKATDAEKQQKNSTAKLNQATAGWTAAQTQLAELESRVHSEDGKSVWLANEMDILRKGLEATKAELINSTLAHEATLKASLEKEDELRRLQELLTNTRKDVELEKQMYEETVEQMRAEAEGVREELGEAKEAARKQVGGDVSESKTVAEKERQVAKLQAALEQAKLALSKEKEEHAEVVGLMRKETDMLKKTLERQGSVPAPARDSEQDGAKGSLAPAEQVKTLTAALEKAEGELNRLKQEHDKAYNALLEDHLAAKTQLASARAEASKLQAEGEANREAAKASEVEGLQAKLQEREEQLLALGKQCEQYKKELNIARREASSLLTRLSQAQHRASAMEAQLEKMKAVHGSAAAAAPPKNHLPDTTNFSMIDGQSFNSHLDPSLYVACQSLLAHLLDLLDKDFLSVPAVTPSEEYVNAPKTTVGIMLSETFVEGTTFGGPAYNSQHVHRGDVIIQVDKVEVDEGSIKEALIGSDVPGSAVILTVRRSTGKETDISLIRMATEDLSSRKRMMEQLVECKAGAVASHNGTIAAKMDGIIRLWTQILIADGQADHRVSETVRKQQFSAKELVTELRSALRALCETKSEHRS